jgi:hypothetical protein
MLTCGGTLPMKYGWIALAVLGLVVALPGAASGQVSVYAEFSASQLSGGPQGDYLYGGQGGVMIQGPTLLHAVLVQADIQGRFVQKNGESFDAILIGPRLSVAPKKYLLKLSPFVEFNVGYGRYNTGANLATTDSLFGVQGGVSRPVSKHLDVVLDYSWADYGYNSSYFEPQSYSSGVIYHFVKQ